MERTVCEKAAAEGGRGGFKLIHPRRDFHPLLTPCKLGIKGGTVSGSDGERRCRLIPKT